MKASFITGVEIIRIRDNMSLEELRKINQETKERNGYVDYVGIFETMGYTRTFGNTYIKTHTA